MPELTDEQKVMRNSTGLLIAEAINRIPASRIGLGILGASVGELVRVAAVDENGTPTAWKHVPLGDIVTNVNLLDNWYFGPGVINQRLVTSMTGYNKYMIDRWRTSGYASTKTTLTDSGLTVQNFSTSGYASIVHYLKQHIPAGATVTLSAIVSLGDGATGISPRFYYDDGTNVTIAASDMNMDGNLIWTAITLEKPLVRVVIRCAPYVSTITFKAVKLEIGSSQTLAHKENGVWVLNELPDPSLELLKCQRYFQVFRTQALRPTYCEDFRPTMALTPTGTDTPDLGSFTSPDGTITYYSASSEPPA